MPHASRNPRISPVATHKECIGEGWGCGEGWMIRRLAMINHHVDRERQTDRHSGAESSRPYQFTDPPPHPLPAPRRASRRRLPGPLSRWSWSCTDAGWLLAGPAEPLGTRQGQSNGYLLPKKNHERKKGPDIMRTFLANASFVKKGKEVRFLWEKRVRLYATWGKNISLWIEHSPSFCLIQHEGTISCTIIPRYRPALVVQQGGGQCISP